MKTKIAHIITKLELGGAQKNTIYTVEKLVRQNFDSWIITGPGGILDEQIKNNKHINSVFIFELVRDIKPVKDLICLFKLIKLLRQEKFDIVHTHSSKAGILGRIAARFAGIKNIYHTVHGWGFTENQNFIKKFVFIILERICAKFTTKLIVVADNNAEKGLEFSIGTRDQYITIRSGIDFEHFRNCNSKEKIKQNYGLKNNEIIIGMVGNFKPQKNPVSFVEIANLLLKDNGDLKFILVGDGILRNKVEDEIKKYNIEEKVILTGWKEYNDVRDICNVFDIFLLTSYHEGLPRSILEAYSLKKPVVATNVDGIPEVVIDNSTGYLFEPDDNIDAVEKINKLINNSELRKQFGFKGYENILNNFSIQKMFDDILALYTRKTTNDLTF